MHDGLALDEMTGRSENGHDLFVAFAEYRQANKPLGERPVFEAIEEIW